MTCDNIWLSTKIRNNLSMSNGVRIPTNLGATCKLFNREVFYRKFFFFNRHCNRCGSWPAQLSLSILSRKVFTECRCQLHVKPPTWMTSDQNVPTPATRCPSRLKRRERTPTAEGGTMGEKFPRTLPTVATSTSLLGSWPIVNLNIHCASYHLTWPYGSCIKF